jgi:hypothetical protein
MSLTVENIIDRARGLMHDRKNGHYVREFLNEQANGANTTFQVRNRNLLQAADGAPTDVKIYISGTDTPITVLDKDAGLVSVAVAPAAQLTVEVRYYFEMATDAEWLDFYRTAAGFIGSTHEVALVTEAVAWDPAYAPAVVQYCAAQASRALASLTHWYYSAQAGNKSFNKDQVSRKFMEQADDWEAQAEKLRLAVPERFDQNKAPAFAYTGPARGTRYWEPRR